MARIQIRRAGTAAAVAPPQPGEDGELAYAAGGFIGAPPHSVAGNDLIISFGSANRVLIGAGRQVELIGAQTITGRKTFPLAALSILGGAPDAVLSTDGVGNLSWVTGIGGGGIDMVEVSPPLDGTGVAGDPISIAIAGIAQLGVVMGAAGAAIFIAANGSLNLTVANTGQVDAGADNTFPITSLQLRRYTGGQPTDLTTAANTIIPAINELKQLIDGLAHNMQFAGVYDVAGNVVTPVTGAPIPPGALVPPTAAMIGHYLICSTGRVGAPGPLPPAGDYFAGDWLIAAPGPIWTHLNLGLAGVHTDGISIAGDGLSPATALEVDLIDCGTYP